MWLYLIKKGGLQVICSALVNQLCIHHDKWSVDSANQSTTVYGEAAEQQQKTNCVSALNLQAAGNTRGLRKHEAQREEIRREQRREECEDRKQI